MVKIYDVNDIKQWLKVILKKVNTKDVSVKILENYTSGYLADILFVYVTESVEGALKEYNLVLKCSKENEVLREKLPVKDSFFNEIYIYETVLPIFTRFQLEKGIEKPFKSVPQCFGSFIGRNIEVIALENLKTSDFFLWNQRNPLSREYISLVVREYGIFHAISVAMKTQQPENFIKLTRPLNDICEQHAKRGDLSTLFGYVVQDIYDALQNEVDEDILRKWKTLTRQTKFIFGDMLKCVDAMQVVTHGDCWIGNFMFNSQIKRLPSGVAMLDWQLAKLASPIFDLSYFLFAGISPEDIDYLDDILEEYYQSFSLYLGRLGDNPEMLYPKSQFLSEWKKFCRYGVLRSSLAIKMCYAAKDEVRNTAQVAENSGDFASTFMISIKDKTNLSGRVKHIVKYVVKNDLIS